MHLLPAICTLFADVARPLHQLTEKGQWFTWTKECDSSFHRLKEALASAPVLAYPESEDLFVLDTDASNVGIGAVLSKVYQGHERVIAYYSQALSKTERNYCTTRHKRLATSMGGSSPVEPTTHLSSGYETSRIQRVRLQDR